MLAKNLLDLGFTPNQAQVYLALLEHDEARAGQLVKETGLHRNIVYTALDLLQKRGLVGSRDEDEVKIFRALDPQALLAEAEVTQARTLAAVEEIRRSVSKVPHEIRIYEGVEAIRSFEISNAYRIPPGSTIAILGVMGARWFEVVGEEIYQQYIKIHREQNLHSYWLGYSYSQQEAQEAAANPDIFSYRYVDGPSLSTTNLEIGEDYVAMKHFGSSPFIVHVMSTEVAADYKKYFQLLWKDAKEVQ